MRTNYIWIKVTLDKYEFPLEIADSARELAEKCGVSEEKVKASASGYKRGVRLITPFRSIHVDWREEDEQAIET